MRRALVTFKEPVFSSFDFFNAYDDFEKGLKNYQSEDFAQFFEAEEAFLAAIDLPGVNLSDIHIESEEGKLMVYAERKNPFEKEATVIKKYSKTINLPKNIDQEKINAHYENGVLNLTLPKLPDHKNRKKIEIQAGQKSKSWTDFLNFRKNDTTAIAN